MHSGNHVHIAACAAILTAGFHSALAGDLKKPDYLKELSLETKESFDDNVLMVSRVGMQAQPSWVTTVSPKIGLDLAPLVGDGKTIKTLTFNYTPDFNLYHGASSETYFAHKVSDSVKIVSGKFISQLDNAFLFNSGSDNAPTYALDQVANQLDKNRSFYTQAVPRERRKQLQDRGTLLFQYDFGDVFVRPIASIIYYDLKTTFHNSTPAPYKGYQNWPDRNDVNGGADLGYKVTKDFAVTLGYRYGHQYQQQFNATIDADNHTSSSDYQRILVGFEGKPVKWLNVKLLGGPDFRSYGALAPVNDRSPIKYYGEGSMTATVNSNNIMTFSFKQWQWVSSTGKVPYFDSVFNFNYHWNATRQLGFDIGGKILEADFTMGNDGATSIRDDRQYSIILGAKYAFNKHVSATLGYTYDMAGNVLADLPAASAGAYRDFHHTLISAGVQYKF